MRFVFFSFLFAFFLLAPEPATAQVAVQGETVYTMNGQPIQDGVVLIRDGQIEEVGSAGSVQIPNGYRTVSAAVVTPGLIDARGTVGLTGIRNQPDDQDFLETSNPIQPELRAIDAYNSREELVDYLRELGVTTVHTGHGPGALMSGQTMIAKTSGNTLSEALVDSVTAVSMTLGPTVSRSFDSPGTRAKGVAMLREQFLQAERYRDRMANSDPDQRPSRNLQMDVLSQVLDGEVKAVIGANRATEIQSALRLADEFGFDLVLEGAAEAYLLLDEISAAGVPVLIHPTMIRAGGETENAAFDTAAKLREAGIPFAFQSGYEGYVPKTRVVLFEAGLAAAHGLEFEDALAGITIDAARILGIDDRVGSLEPGKDADIALFDGDPFEYTTHVCTVIINGEIVSDECH